jgi:hypothetical protein
MLDAPASSSTNFTASSGRSNKGLIFNSTDRDWYRIFLDPSFTYSFRVLGKKRLDPIIDVRNSSGLSLAFNDDQSSSSRDSLINFRPSVAGAYYLDVGSYASTTGRYRLSISRSPGFVSPNLVRTPSQVAQPLPARQTLPVQQPAQQQPAPTVSQPIQSPPTAGSREWYEWALRNGIGTSRPGQDVTGTYRGPSVWSNPVGVNIL